MGELVKSLQYSLIQLSLGALSPVTAGLPHELPLALLSLSVARKLQDDPLFQSISQEPVQCGIWEPQTQEWLNGPLDQFHS